MQREKRKGARTPALVPFSVRASLQAGEPSANHMEQIAIDMSALLTWSFPALASFAPRLRVGGLVSRMRNGGELLHDAIGPDAWSTAGLSSSDTVRGWGAMAIGACPDLDLTERLVLVEPFADDPHFAVREWAWLSVRPHVEREPRRAIQLLTAWVEEPSSRVRRFASEVTRPRGVWSRHIGELKRSPELASVLLEPLRADPSPYVQDSVGNWLNDASKSAPDWVIATCGRWSQLSPHPATRRICKRALRTLRRMGLES